MIDDLIIFLRIVKLWQKFRLFRLKYFYLTKRKKILGFGIFEDFHNLMA